MANTAKNSQLYFTQVQQDGAHGPKRERARLPISPGPKAPAPGASLCTGWGADPRIQGTKGPSVVPVSQLERYGLVSQEFDDLGT